MLKKATYKRRKEVQLKRCKICGLVFQCFRSDARYCSPMCRQAISREIRRQKRVSSFLIRKKIDGVWIDFAPPNPTS